MCCNRTAIFWALGRYLLRSGVKTTDQKIRVLQLDTPEGPMIIQPAHQVHV
jgi:hypothetical protein